MPQATDLIPPKNLRDRQTLSRKAKTLNNNIHFT